ncbi:MAG: hypothetical protein FJ217_04455 [Ignavibacteria bacterium]|nr:hypothetical protein [Ignavibacteria bacterium]
MGRASLFLVLGLSLAFGIIGFSMRRTTTSLVEAQTGYSKYLFARNLARTAIHTTLRAFDRNLTPIPEAGAFNGGSYAVQYQENHDTLWLKSTGMYAESTYTMRVKLFRTTKPFPRVGAAIGIRATPVNFLIAGHAKVDGRNYDSTGTNLVGSGDVPGVATMTSSDSTTVAKEKDEIQGAPPIKVDTSTIDPLPFLDEYKSNADYVYNVSGVYNTVTWGTESNPVIVYCNAGDDTTFSIKFTGNVVGWGILVVRGNVQFNGNFDFKGLVVVDGFNTVVQFGAAGTPQIVGGVIIAGNAGASVALKGTGANAKVKYSADALDKARRIGKLRYYSIIEWYE